MCRIAGIINRNFEVVQLEQIVQSMCDCLVHGGPDDGGTYTVPEKNVVLGNRRLALQDLSHAGHMPMHYGARYTITYNGEIYNFPELKKELKALGYSFHNDTDTEVILAAFSHWNTQAFCKFNGMYAFALWDHQYHELYLVRDAVGIKPLYYSTVSNGLCFASEVQALKNIPYLKNDNENWPVYLMAYGHIPEPVTTLAGVHPLKKGCFLKYNYNTGETSLQSISHYSYIPELSNRNEVLTGIRRHLEESVERHLISDAAIGVFLSGGIDSGILALVASASKKSRLNTLSLYFNEKEYSEKKYQDIIISKLNCNAHQYLLDESHFHTHFPEILDDMDMPGCDGINTWFISKYAKAQGLKAVLSGNGSDELFGGYPSFDRMKYTEMMQWAAHAGIHRLIKSKAKQIKRISYLTMEGVKGAYLFLRGHFPVSDIALQLGATEKEIWNILNDLPVFNSISQLSYGNKASWMEFNMYMQNQLLRDADVMGMAHSVEIRVPFLDDRLIRYVTSVKSSLKYEGHIKKQLLVDSFIDVLPAEIWNRPKMGFSFPFAKWLGNNSYIKDTLAGGDKILLENQRRFQNQSLHWSQFLSLVMLKKNRKI